MGLFDRLERSLERAVNGAFAKAFKSSVQPVEIASAMRRAMDDRAAATSKIHGRTASQATVPNMFTVELSTKDYDDLTAHADELTDELLASCEEHMESQRYKTAGPMRIVFAENTELDTGVFTLRPASARRPFDITPDGLADRSVPAHHGYEEYDEMSIGMPVEVEDDDEPAPTRRSDRHRTTAPAARHQLEPVGEDDGYDDSYESSSYGDSGYGDSGYGDSAYGDSPENDARYGDPYGMPGIGQDDAPRASRSGWDDGHLGAAAAAAGSSTRRPPAPVPEPVPSYESPREEPDLYSRPTPAEYQAKPTTRRAVARRPWLDIDGDRYPLLGAVTIIGRDHASDIVLDDPGISRKHAELRVTSDGPHPVITLVDLGSTNGVFVNGERVQHTHVRDGDRITLGRSSMTLRTGR